MYQIITIKDLTKKFGSFTAVDHLNIHVREGEIFGFPGLLVHLAGDIHRFNYAHQEESCP